MKHLVSAPFLKLAADVAERMMKDDPQLHEAWLDQLRTSKASHDIGVIALETNYDWVVAFFAWYHDRNAKFPRDL